ncbi:hypothetical protein [Mameliella alba]|nr:hypothetical protein [Mameliella alba]
MDIAKITVTPRRWWTCTGLVGAALAAAGLKLGLPLRIFCKVKVG